jgi:hypothetical protein
VRRPVQPCDVARYLVFAGLILQGVGQSDGASGHHSGLQNHCLIKSLRTPRVIGT